MRSLTPVKMIIFCWLGVCMTSVSTFNTTHTHTVTCCDFWKALSTYTKEKTGSKMSYEQCMKENECTENKLIKQFLHQSNRLTKQNLQFLSGNEVHVDTTSWSPDVVASLLAWAFVGRIVSAEQSSDNLFSLIYDFQTDKLSLERTTCEFDRSIYTSMVSVSLLTYFVVHRVIKQSTNELPDNPGTFKPEMTLSTSFLMQPPYTYTSLRQK